MATPTLAHHASYAPVTLPWEVPCFPQTAAAEQGEQVVGWVCQTVTISREPVLPSRVAETSPGLLRPGIDWTREFCDRLISVSELPDNWDGEGACRVDRAILNAARDLASRLEPDGRADMPVPQVVPDVTGHLHLTWWRSRDYFAIALVNEREAVCLTKRGSEFTQYYCPTDDLREIRRRLHAFINSIP